MKTTKSNAFLNIERDLDEDGMKKWLVKNAAIIDLNAKLLSERGSAINAAVSEQIAPQKKTRAAHTSRAAAGAAMRAIYGDSGPDGVKNEDLLAFVNERLQKENRSVVSLTTALRARKTEYGW